MRTRPSLLRLPAVVLALGAALLSARAEAAGRALIVTTGSEPKVASYLRQQIQATGMYPDGIDERSARGYLYDLSGYKLVVWALGSLGMNSYDTTYYGNLLASYLTQSRNNSLVLFYPNSWRTGTPPPLAGAFVVSHALTGQVSTETAAPTSYAGMGSDPLVADVPAFACGGACQRLTGLMLRPAGQAVASWADGNLLAIRAPNRVDLNLPPADDSAIPGSFEPQGGRIIQNAIRLLSRPLHVTPESLVLPQRAPGVPASATVTFRNHLNAPVEITALEFDGPDKAHFSVSGVALPLTLGSGASLTVPVTFRGPSSGSFAAALTAKVAGLPATHVVLSASARGNLHFDGLPLDFGGLPPGSAAVTRKITIRNIGTTAADIDKPVLSPPVAQFTFDPAADAVRVGAGASAEFTLKFDPAGAAGAFQSSLRFAWKEAGFTGAGSPVDLPVIGRAGPPALGAVPGAIALAEVPVNEQGAPEVLTLANAGNSQLTVDLSSDSAEFKVSPAALSIAPGASATCRISFAPTTAGLRSGSLTLRTNVPGDRTITLSGKATTPKWSLSATDLSFGAIAIAPAIPPRSVVLSNDGDGTIQVTRVEILAGPGADSFVVSPPALPLSLGPGKQQPIDVILRPRAAGLLSATLRVTTNVRAAPTADVKLSAEASGAVARVSPLSLSFGEQKIRNTGKRTLTLKNTGNRELLLRGVQVLQAPGGPFAAGAMRDVKIAAGAAQDIEVRFTPLGGGLASAQLVLDTDDPATAGGTRFTIALSGTGVVVGLQADPLALSFPTVYVGQRSPVRSFVVRNTGTVAIDSLTVMMSGAQDRDFAILPGYEHALAPGDQTTVQVVFEPRVAQQNNKATAVVVADNMAGKIAVELSGSSLSPVLSAHPSAVSFPATAAGSEAPPAYVTLYNEEAGPLDLDLVPPPGGQFVLDGATQLTLAPGGSARVALRFTPTAAGSHSDVLGVAMRGSAVPLLVVPLSGQATEPVPVPEGGCTVGRGPVTAPWTLLLLLGLLCLLRRKSVTGP
jgi:hypothetical protein